ncbi:MAG: hypothetical protein V2A56_05735 [bacterium]
MADQASEKLTGVAHLVGESEVRDEKRADDDAAYLGERGIVHGAAALRVGSDSGTSEDCDPVSAGADVLERVAGRVCVVCGQGGGVLVRMVDRPFGGHTRASP